MANRAKRLAKESALMESDQAFKTQFHKEKKCRRNGIRPRLQMILEVEHKNEITKEKHGDYFKKIINQKLALKTKHPKGYYIYRKMLKEEAPLFSRIESYQKFASALFELNTHRTYRSWKRPRSKRDEVIFESLFRHLFVRFSFPKFMSQEVFNYVSWWSDVSNEHLQVIYQVARGAGIHHTPGLEFKMNGKMNYFFYQAPAHFDIPKAVWWAKIKSMKVQNSIALQLVDNLQVEWNYRWKTKWQDWHNDLIFFINQQKNIAQRDLKKVVQFAIHQKNGGLEIQIPQFSEAIHIPSMYPDFIFKGRSVASVLRYVDNWNNYLKMIRETGICGSFKVSKVTPFRKVHNKSILLIRQITTLKGLHKEGHHMKHCVASYAENCIQGTSSIWSLRQQLPNGKMKLMLTIEVEETSRKILQVYGKSNRDPKDHEWALVKKWADREELIIAVD